MAITHRKQARTLSLYQALHQTPYAFDFYLTMRQLECLHSDHPRIGEAVRPQEEPVRFSQQPSTIFAPATLSAFSLPHSDEQQQQDRRPQLSMWHFGLFGPNGPLPLHLTEYAKEREDNADDPTLRRFADLFHHRLFALFYRAWANSQPAVSLDRPDEDRYGLHVGSLLGIGDRSLLQRDAMPDMSKLHYAGWLSSQTGSAEGLEAMVQDFFHLPVRVYQFIGHWLHIPPEGQFRLGESEDTGALGSTSIIGASVWDRQNKFRIAIGPLTREQFNDLLPGSKGLKRLVAIVRNYTGDQLTWDLNLIMQKDQVRPTQLGEQSRLGWTSNMTNVRPDKDLTDLIIDPLARRGIHCDRS